MTPIKPKPWNGHAAVLTMQLRVRERCAAVCACLEWSALPHVII